MAVPAEHVARIVDPAAYADGSIYETYRWLRANDPWGVIEADGYDRFRVVTRHADIQELSRDAERFHNGPQPILTTQVAIRKTQEQFGGAPINSLIHMDPPEHQKYRQLTSAWFQPGNLRALEGAIRALARRSVDRMAALGGRCDFVNEIALHYPLLVVMAILGLPEEDEPLMLRLTQEMFGANDPDINATGNTSTSIKDENARLDMSSFMQMAAYFNALTEQRRKQPTDDLASVIANATIDGQPMNPMATMGYYIITATAGHDTTSSSTGGGMWALAENPAEFAKLKADPALLPSFVDEAIRWTTPVKHFMRRATQDTVVNGQPLAKDEWLMLCYASANRDEAMFPDANRFLVDRKPNRHIAFGYGAHLCLGQYLGRMEMRILFEELLPRLDSVELDGDPAMMKALFVNGPKRLPLRYVMR
ncbi:MAG: cytochrome P450 [Sphingomonadales bacterium]|nr:cytochrome P450 [Sphingomonadales bacterium]